MPATSCWSNSVSRRTRAKSRSCHWPPTTRTTSMRPAGPTSELDAAERPAVYDQVDAGAEGRGRARQEDDRASDLLRSAVALHADPLPDLLEQLRAPFLNLVPVAAGKEDRPRR